MFDGSILRDVWEERLRGKPTERLRGKLIPRVPSKMLSITPNFDSRSLCEPSTTLNALWPNPCDFL